MFVLGIYIVFSRKNFGDHNDFVLFDIKNNTQKRIVKASLNSNCDIVLNDIIECTEKDNPDNIGKMFLLTHNQFTKINENCILKFVEKSKIYPKPIF